MKYRLSDMKSDLTIIHEILLKHSTYIYAEDKYLDKKYNGFLLPVDLVSIAKEIEEALEKYDPYGEGDALADEARNAEISKMI